MYELIKLYWEICIFKKAPQDVPYSRFVFWLSMIVYASIGLLAAHLSGNWLTAIFQVIIEILLITGFTGVLLLLSNKTARFIQTTSAMLGTDALISFLSLPVLSVMITARMTNLPYYLLGVLMLWHWLVTGYIFSNALSKPFLLGVTVSLLYLLGSYQIMAMLLA